MLHLASPFWLALLIIPGIVVFLMQRQNKPTQQLALTHPMIDALANNSIAKPSKNIPWWWLLGMILLPLALAKPQWVDTESEDTRYGRDIMLALDVSGSTRAQDFIIDGEVIDRLDMIKHVANNFIDQRKGDRIGVIIFGDDAYTLIPMTPDHATVKKLIADLENNIAGEKTALGDALALAAKRLKDSEQQERIVILLTDGANTSGNTHPLIALEAAKQHQLRIHTIGIGSHRRVAFPKGTLETPELVQMPLDEALLQQVAHETGGLYFMGESSEALNQISDDINQIEQSKHRPHGGATTELYWLPLLLSMCLLFIASLRLSR